MSHALRILIADVFELFRRVVCSTLRQTNGLLISEASNSLEAIEKVEELPPDLMLLDFGLPSLNGIEVARRVLRLSPVTKILFVSQEASADVVQGALNTGARGYVEKIHAANELPLAVEAVRSGRYFVSSGLRFCLPTDAVLAAFARSPGLNLSR